MKSLAERYNEATTYAADVFEDCIEGGRLDFPDYTFADALAGYSSSISMGKRADERWYEISGGMDLLLAGFAQNDERFFDLCCHICSTNIIMGRPVPSGLESFAAGVLIQTLERPKIRNRPKSKNWLEKSFLWSVTKELVSDFDLKMTRNDEPSGCQVQMSSCDAVTEALNLCGRKTRYPEIKNLMVHPDSETLRSEFEAISRVYQLSAETGTSLNALSPDYMARTANAATKDASLVKRFVRGVG